MSMSRWSNAFQANDDVVTDTLDKAGAMISHHSAIQCHSLLRQWRKQSFFLLLGCIHLPQILSALFVIELGIMLILLEASHNLFSLRINSSKAMAMAIRQEWSCCFKRLDQGTKQLNDYIGNSGSFRSNKSQPSVLYIAHHIEKIPYRSC